MLQNAAVALNEDLGAGLRVQSLEILEKEMKDTIRCIRAALLPLFALLSSPSTTTTTTTTTSSSETPTPTPTPTITHETELAQIVKLRVGSAQRQDRIERWVDSISTPGSQQNVIPHPMAFAAFMIGLPIGPGSLADGDDDFDADPFGYLEQADDPDLDDLREEYRPRMKERLEGWVEAASVLRGGGMVLGRFMRGF